MKKEDLIKNYAFSLGFDDIGFAMVGDGNSPYKDEFLKAIDESRIGPLDYLQKNSELRANIKKFHEQSKTVIIVLKNYYKGDFPENSEASLKISRYAWGKDYHHWFKKNLKLLSDFILEEIDVGADNKIFNDTAPVLERAWAEKAFLGFIGKSGMFISRKFGTWIFIGGISTSLELDGASSDQYESMCGSCTKCIDACPSKAIVAPKKVDANLCISTWNIEKPLFEYVAKKKVVSIDWGFGCDICQEVCPWNKFEQFSKEERFNIGKDQQYLSVKTLRKDLRGTGLYRTKKEGLLVTMLRSNGRLIF